MFFQSAPVVDSSNGLLRGFLFASIGGDPETKLAVPRIGLVAPGPGDGWVVSRIGRAPAEFQPGMLSGDRILVGY